jgi:hypothetical protein
MPIKKGKAAAKEQLRVDYETAIRQFCLPDNGKESYKMFCLGVTMCMLTLKGLVEEEDNRFDPNQSVEDAADMYYESARSVLHAD